MKIHAIQTGEVQIRTRHVEARYGPRPARVFDILRDRNWSPRLPIRAWAIEHPEGVIVVDTGERLRALCRSRPVIFLPTHDPESAQRLAAGQATTLD